MAFTEKQQTQESEYVFPYHYLDIARKEIALLEFYDSRYRMKRGIEFFQLGKDLKILDAGCGDGRFLYEMRKSGATLYGVDYSKKALEFAKVFVPDAMLMTAPITKIPLPDGSLDGISCIETIEHLPLDEVPIAIAEFHRLLKKGGKLYITVPSKNQPLTHKHYQHFTNESLTKSVGDKFDARIEGYQSKSAWPIWWILRVIGSFFVYYHKRIGFYYRFMGRFASKKLGKCPPEQGRNLIALCVKK